MKAFWPGLTLSDRTCTMPKNGYDLNQQKPASMPSGLGGRHDLVERRAGAGIGSARRDCEEETEGADRFESLMQELERLTELDLAGIEPITIFPEEASHG